MKVWPIITLGGLLWGSTFSDSHNAARESRPHSRGHVTELDIDFPPTMPHRPATFAYRNFFNKMLAQEDGTDWTVDGKTISQTGDDDDDGDDPGKKLFWKTVFGENGLIDPGCWCDPTAREHLFPQAYGGNLPPGFLDGVYTTTTRVVEHTGVIEPAVFDGPTLKQIARLTDDEAHSVVEKLTRHDRPHHHHHHPHDPTDPGGGDPVSNPTDPGDPVITGPVGGGGSIGAPVPEPSTWALLIAGFGLIGLAGWRRARFGG